jgi:hypothetical protein
MRFEVIPDDRPVIRHRDPIFTWPEECFDGRQRLVTPAQVTEMGYAAPGGADNSFRTAAARRGLRAMVVRVLPCRAYPNGGLAVRALKPKQEPAPLPPPPEMVVPPPKPARVPRPVPEAKTCGCWDHPGGNPAPAAAFDPNRSRSDGLSAWCRDCQQRHFPKRKKRGSRRNQAA